MRGYNLWKFDTLYSDKMILGKVMDAIKFTLPQRPQSLDGLTVAFILGLSPPSEKYPRGHVFTMTMRAHEKIPRWQETEGIMRKAEGQFSNRPHIPSPRPERNPAIRSQWEHNKKIILARDSICGICGKPVDKSLKYPDPMSPTIDHIIPVSKRGDPIALENLQLAHRCCNRLKSDHMPTDSEKKSDGNKIELPQSANWRTD